MNPQSTINLNIDTVKSIATLSRLTFNEAEIQVLHKELERILQNFQNISDVKIQKHLKTQGDFVIHAFASQTSLDETISHLRPDQYHNSLSTKDFITATPEHEGVFVRVPAVLNQDN